ncbi:MAG: creatininase [Phycisphaeraceae bacterium]|nr:creatininase [Phycisphaeraceae bacterium]
MRPWKLEETSYGQVRGVEYEVAVVPLGATEPHNLHLPYGTDSFEAKAVGDRICAEAHARGAKVIMLPVIPYGTETNMRRLPLAINIDPSTLNAVVTDVVGSLAQSGLRKIVILNSHGGNDLKPLLRELYGRTSAHLFLCDWYRILGAGDVDIFDEPEDHAGEMETSLALACFPDLVDRGPDGSITADEGRKTPMRFEALNEGWVSITRAWHLLTTNSGAGNPHAASADKGERALKLLEDRLAKFLVELSDADVDDRFPFQ